MQINHAQAVQGYVIPKCDIQYGVDYDIISGKYFNLKHAKGKRKVDRECFCVLLFMQNVYWRYLCIYELDTDFLSFSHAG